MGGDLRLSIFPGTLFTLAMANNDFIHQATAVARTRFCFTELKAHQQAALEAVSCGKDSLVVVSTGGGKSHCYVIPSMLLEGIVLVISPLIALIRDQV